MTQRVMNMLRITMMMMMIAKGVEREEEEKIMMVKKKERGAQCKNFCLLIGYCEPGSKPSMLYNL